VAAIAFTPTTSLKSDERRFSQGFVTSGVLGFAFPAHVLLIQDDVLAGNPEHAPVPHRNVNLSAVNLPGCR
jgi:hypothetical protein